MTSEAEMSAYLENSRGEDYGGYIDKIRNRNRRNIYKEYSEYKEILEYILLWKEDKSQYHNGLT